MAAEVNRSHPSWLVDRDGNFNPNIEPDLNLADENCPFAAVSIIGVQSSGKSTLLNKCFSTNFEEMDQSQGMSQTTKGIWLAKWPSPDGGLKILFLDTEGSDGVERGLEDDDTFEKKIALFALAMSNTLIFNMRCDSVNLHNGAGRPLLKTVLKVMLRKFSKPGRVNLVFVLRDKNKCPLDLLRRQLIQGIQEIWQGLFGTQSNVNAALEDYFNIEVMVMSHYEHKDFDNEVGYLRERVITLVQQGEVNSTASRFAALARENWKDIMEDRILNLQLNKITVDGVICRESAEKKIKNFRSDGFWDQIKRDVRSGNVVEGFGNEVNAIIRNYLSEYDEETQDADESKRIEHRKELHEWMLEDVERIHLTLVENMRNAKLETFQEALVQVIKGGGGIHQFAAKNREILITEFNDLLTNANIEQANWNHSNEQLDKLKSELDAYEKAACSIVALLKEMKTKKTLLWIGVATLGVSVLACATVGGAIWLSATTVSAAAQIPARSSLSALFSGAKNAKIGASVAAATSAALGSLSALFSGAKNDKVGQQTSAALNSFSSFITAASNSMLIDRELSDALRNPAASALWARLVRS